MKIFNRNLLLKDLLSRSVTTLMMAIRVFSLFKNPYSVIGHYFKGTTPDEKYVLLKNNASVFFSSHPHDLITTLIVFARKDYGEVRKGSIVIDIGANIGIFSLYCAYCGAKSVFSIEPNSEAFGILTKNTTYNKLDKIIKPIKAAVSDKKDQELLIPITSSPYNAVIEKNDKKADENKYDSVATTTLESIMLENKLETVDLLKIDCEGHEFTIVPSLSPSTLNRIREIKLEYQGNDVMIIINHLTANAFNVVKHERDERFNGGMLWLSKKLA